MSGSLSFVLHALLFRNHSGGAGLAADRILCTEADDVRMSLPSDEISLLLSAPPPPT